MEIILLYTPLTYLQIFVVPYAKGYLLRNFKGVWYPTCKPVEKWAKQSCRAVLGHLEG